MSKSPMKNARLPAPSGVGKRKRSRPSNQPKSSRGKFRPDKPRILQAVRDQYDQVHYRFGTSTRSHWFSNAELISEKTAVLKRVSSHGALLLTPQSQTKFIELVASHKGRTRGRVAERPGYLTGAYAFADGTFAKADPNSAEPLFATFEPDARFEPNGTLRKWERLISPLVKGQPLLLFVIAHALVGAMLRYVPGSLSRNNPLVELCGAHGCGKSIAAMLVASVWSHDPDSDIGGAETWDLTINSLDDLKVLYNFACMVIDESNLADLGDRARAELIKKAIFKLFSTSSKRRKGQRRAPSSRYSVLSTANTPLADYVTGDNHTRNAVLSRLVTIKIYDDRPFGILDTLPAGYSDSGEAVDAITDAIDKAHGSPSRCFVGYLLQQEVLSRAGLVDTIRGYISEFREHSKQYHTKETARTLKTFTLIYASARLAARAGILTDVWGDTLAWCTTLYRNALGDVAAQRPAALDRIRAFMTDHMSDIVPAPTKAFSKEAFEAKAGILLEGANGRRTLIIPYARFREEFADHKRFSDALKDEGLIETEGQNRKRSYKMVSLKICSDGKGYHIKLK